MDKAKPARISSLLVYIFFLLVSCLSLWAQSPVVTGLNPGAGPVGSTVTISGTNLGASTGTVTFSGVTAAVIAWNAGQVTAVVPMSATTGSVVVTTSGGLVATGVPFTVTGVTYAYDDLGRLVAVVDPLGNGASYAYDAVGNILSIQRYSATQVSVISFAPGQGAAGSTVVVSGTGFSSIAAQNAVTFNGVAATVSSSTPSQITVTVPVSATSGPIVVTSPLGSATSAATFIVKPDSGVPTITTVAPSVALAGTAIALTGTNFDPVPANDRVAVNLTPVNPSAATATSLSFTVPAGGTSGRIYLDAPGGMAVNPPDLFIPFGVHTVADVGYTGRMTVGGSQAVTLSGGSKIGLLLFDGRISQRVNLQFSGDTFGADCRLYLFAPDGSSPFSNYCTGSSTILTLNASGSYLVGIEGGAAAGSVTVGVTDDSDVVTSIQIDGPAVSVTSAAGQDIRLVFNAIAGQRVVAQVSNLLAPTTLYFFGPITQQVLSNGATLFLDTQLLPASGTYTIRLTHTGAASGSALVTLISVPPDFTAPITIGGSAVRVPASGNTAIGQNGVLTFSGTAGQKVSASLSSGTYPSGGCLVTIKDPSGTPLTSSYCDSGSFADTITLAATGTYTIFHGFHCYRWFFCDRHHDSARAGCASDFQRHRRAGRCSPGNKCDQPQRDRAVAQARWNHADFGSNFGLAQPDIFHRKADAGRGRNLHFVGSTHQCRNGQ